MSFFKTRSERALKQIEPQIQEILAYGKIMEAMSEKELKGQTDKFRQMLKEGKSLDRILPEAFATVREAAFRVTGMKPYPVQLIGGIMLHKGCIAEMKTGEGKTLVCAAPAYLNALTGNPVHVVTVNDYLAKRDAEEIGQIHRFLGLTVGCVLSEMPSQMRKAAYNCDITYVTNNELGFDYLRDNMAMSSEETVLRELSYAIIDEADSVLIDEARTPLIISGQGEKSSKMYQICDVLANQMDRGTYTEFSIAQMLDPDEFHESGDYAVNEKDKNVILTAAGIEKIEAFFRIDDLSDPKNMMIHHHMMLALRAKELMHRDKDYIVKDNKVEIVDEFTGRVMPDRRYSDGLHQAIEAKEGAPLKEENRTYATITFQSFFNKYKKKAGMTGTAMTEKEEFRNIYGMDVIAIPTNKPVIRVDHEDAVYKTMEEKYDAIVKKVKEVHEKGQPVLVGTTDIETSEILSKRLGKEGIKHRVLNAKNHELEAAIIAKAGEYGAVTLATNMAGRGTDIKPDEKAKEAGGLYVIGTRRHESRRIDNQLSGRSGRQGDPGESKFYISLEDKLMQIFAKKNLMELFDSFEIEKGEEISSPLLSKAINKAQKKVESANYSAREQLLKYDRVNQKQCEDIYRERAELVESQDVNEVILFYLLSFIDNYEKAHSEETAEEVIEAIHKTLPLYLFESEEKKEKSKMVKKKAAIQALKKEVEAKFHERMNALAKEERKEEVNEDLRRVILHAINKNWSKQLEAMEKLKEGIGLTAYAGTDPTIEYEKQGMQLFEKMQRQIKNEVLAAVFGLSTVPAID